PFKKYLITTRCFIKEINKILDKIAKSGYDSLTKDEKEQLFRMSNKNK
ncbi:DUF6576 domain-containing protein, partial [Bacteroidota bacterium]